MGGSGSPPPSPQPAAPLSPKAIHSPSGSRGNWAAQYALAATFHRLTKLCRMAKFAWLPAASLWSCAHCIRVAEARVDGARLRRYVTNFEPRVRGKEKRRMSVSVAGVDASAEWQHIKVSGKREFRVMVAGMQGAGKSTLVMQLEKRTEIAWEPPLTSINGQMSVIKHAKNSLIMWDMSGSVEGRKMWAQHLEDQLFSAIIFVVDATSPMELSIAKLELKRLLSSPHVNDACSICILANKHDHRPSSSMRGSHSDVLTAGPCRMCALDRVTGTGHPSGQTLFSDAF